MKNSNLMNLIEETNKGSKYVNIKSLPNRTELENQGYHFIDEKAYITEISAFISMSYPETVDFAPYLVMKRNFKHEFEELGKINEIIPENSVKPIALVYDDSISKNYIRGYITKIDGRVTPLKNYLTLEKKINSGIENIIDIENQLYASVNKLKSAKIYSKLPEGTLSLDNIYVTEKNKVVLMNLNYFLDFSDKNPKYLDKELKRTIRYIEKSLP
ncbi:MAG: hypothetical protein ACP5MV_03755 [Candidatus Parvarchaeum sp.]